MLIGGSDHNVDKKGRIFIPSRFKGDFGDSIVICANAFGKKCLWGFAEDGFEKFCNKLNKLPYSKMQDIYRFLSNSAAFAELDASGRVLLPAPLRAFAGIENEVHIVGMKNHIEIWGMDEWKVVDGGMSPEKFAPVVDEVEFSFGD